MAAALAGARTRGYGRAEMAPVFGAIDIGTNSVLLVVARREEGGAFTPICERAEITRLGKGVDATGKLAGENVSRTASAVGQFAEQARSLGAQEIACVATSAARDAQNGAEFFHAVERQAGLVPEVIAGDEEARLSYLATEREFGSGAKVVIDIGGGSTEFIFGKSGAIDYRHSFNVGSVRLTERFIRSDPPRASEREAVGRLLDETFAALPQRIAEAEVVGIAGTVTTLLCVVRAIEPYQSERVHGQILRRDEVDACAERLWGLSVEGRMKLPGVQLGRADVIAAGASVLSRALHKLGADSVRVSERGVRWGLLYSRFGAKP